MPQKNKWKSDIENVLLQSSSESSFSPETPPPATSALIVLDKWDTVSDLFNPLPYPPKKEKKKKEKKRKEEEI